MGFKTFLNTIAKEFFMQKDFGIPFELTVLGLICRSKVVESQTKMRLMATHLFQPGEGRFFSVEHAGSSDSQKMVNKFTGARSMRQKSALRLNPTSRLHRCLLFGPRLFHRCLLFGPRLLNRCLMFGPRLFRICTF